MKAAWTRIRTGVLAVLLAGCGGTDATRAAVDPGPAAEATGPDVALGDVPAPDAEDDRGGDDAAADAGLELAADVAFDPGADLAVDGDEDVPDDAPATPDPGPSDPGSADLPPTDAVERPVFRWCAQGVPPPFVQVDWTHTTTGLFVVSQGDPGHYAQDVVAMAGDGTVLSGRFQYGPFNKDLEDERVEVLLDDCSGTLVRLGEVATDSDGWARLAVDGASTAALGAYAVRFRVLGDGSEASSTLWVLSPGTKTIVTDIDGTLTTSDMELIKGTLADYFSGLLGGTYVPEARAGARDMTARRGPGQGFVLVYLTGRPHDLIDATRGWLADLGFAPGIVHVTDVDTDILPTEGGVGDYKTAYLGGLATLGVDVVLAYGNASTDIYAYANVGIPAGSTFVTGTNGGSGGTVDLGEDYLAHLAAIAGEPAVVQPFDWP